MDVRVCVSICCQVCTLYPVHSSMLGVQCFSLTPHTSLLSSPLHSTPLHSLAIVSDLLIGRPSDLEKKQKKQKRQPTALLPRGLPHSCLPTLTFSTSSVCVSVSHLELSTAKQSGRNSPQGTSAAAAAAPRCTRCGVCGSYGQLQRTRYLLLPVYVYSFSPTSDMIHCHCQCQCHCHCQMNVFSLPVSCVPPPHGHASRN